MANFEVLIKQNLKYTEEMHAEFETCEQAVTFCEMIFNSCKSVTCTISRIEGGEDLSVE